MIRLKELRNSTSNPKGRKISQQEIADIIGTKRSTVSMWELGASDPDTESVKKIAEYFNVTTDFVLGIEEQDTYYHDPEVAEMINAAHKDHDLRALFSASKKLTKDELQAVLSMIKVMSKEG